MARRYGNAGNVSSLISSARSAYEKSQALQDQISGLEFENSAKTAEDADKYKTYLASRAKTYEQTDPMKYNTMMQKVVTTNRAFVSAETGRLSNQVIEGNMSNTQKYQQLGAFYQQAMQNGDENLAQRLYGTLDRLSMTIQNEQIAANNAATAAGNKAYSTGLTNMKRTIQDNKDVIAAAQRDLKLGNVTAKEYYDGYVDKATGKKVPGIGALYATQKQLLEANAAAPGLKPEDAYDFQQQVSKLEADSGYSKAVNSRSYAAQYRSGAEPQVARIGKDGNIEYVDKNQLASLNGVGMYSDPGTIANKAALGKGSGGAYAKTSIGSGTSKQSLQLQAFKSIDNPLLKDYGNFYYAYNKLDNKTYIVDENGNVSREIDMNNPESVAKGVNDVLPKVQGGNFLTKFLSDVKGKQISNDLRASTMSAADKFRQMGFNDLADQAGKLNATPVSTNGFYNPFGGQSSLNDFSNKLKDLQTVADQRQAVNQANAASNAALAALPKAAPALPTPNFNNGTVQGAIGPVAIPAATKKAVNTIGSDAFNQNYLAGPSGKNLYKL